MRNFDYKHEIERSISHFIYAFSHISINRYDIDKNITDIIKVPVSYSKSRIYKDLINSDGHIILPVISVSLNSVSQNGSRNYNKTHEFNTFHVENNKQLHIYAPVPMNLSFEMTITTKFLEDMLQIISIISCYFNPYIILKMREPVTNKEIQCEVLWDGNISFNKNDQLGQTDVERHIATTSFTFKTLIYKTQNVNANTICCFDVDFENFENEKFNVSGSPKIKNFSPKYIKLNETSQVTLLGEFLNNSSVYLSGENSKILDFQKTHNIFPNSEIYNPFKGVKLIDNINITENTIIFDLLPKNIGKIDIIILNDCGYVKLSEIKEPIFGDDIISCSGTEFVELSSGNIVYDENQNLYNDFSNMLNVYSQWNEDCEFGDCLTGSLGITNIC